MYIFCLKNPWLNRRVWNSSLLDSNTVCFSFRQCLQSEKLGIKSPSMSLSIPSWLPQLKIISKYSLKSITSQFDTHKNINLCKYKLRTTKPKHINCFSLDCLPSNKVPSTLWVLMDKIWITSQKAQFKKLETKPYFANYIQNLPGKNIIFNVLKITLK